MVEIIGTNTSMRDSSIAPLAHPKKQLFLLVRHAQRADDPCMPWQIKQKQDEVIIEYDPQLSRPIGRDQALLTGKTLAKELKNVYHVEDLDRAEIFIFSSPFLTCVESSAAIAKALKVKTVNVQDQLSDMLMKSWFPEDPFLNLSVKLTSNKEPFTNFLRGQYGTNSLQLEYKRQSNQVSYPETIDQTYKRLRNFYKQLLEKYFKTEEGKVLEHSRIVICVTHGVPTHNPFLHLFESDKEVVYLDYNAITVVEKTFLTLQEMQNIQERSQLPENEEMKDKDDIHYEDLPEKLNPQHTTTIQGNGAQVHWEVRKFADATHIPGSGLAML